MEWKIKKIHWFRLLTDIFLAFILSVGFLFIVNFIQKKQALNDSLKLRVEEQKSKEVKTSDIPVKKEAVLEKNQIYPLLSSENYQVTQLSFNGNLVNLDDTENMPLELSDIRGEAGLNKDEKEARIFLSWKTNKLAVSKVEYFKNGEQNKKTIKESEYGFQHSIVISNLDPGGTYTYIVTVKDHWGNTKTSGYYAVYTGSPKESVFDLISNEFDELFGWAFKK